MAIIAASATRMMRFKRNFAANLLAGAAVALAQLLFVPFYVRLLGVESYALIGVLIAFQGLAQLLDLGIAATISREVARYEVRPEATDEARHFVRTFEAVYWLMAVVLGFARARAFGASTRWFSFAAVCLLIYHIQFILLGIVAIMGAQQNDFDSVLSFGAFFNVFVLLGAFCAIMGFVRLTSPPR